MQQHAYHATLFNLGMGKYTAALLPGATMSAHDFASIYIFRTVSHPFSSDACLGNHSAFASMNDRMISRDQSLHAQKISSDQPAGIVSRTRWQPSGTPPGLAVGAIRVL